MYSFGYIHIFPQRLKFARETANKTQIQLANDLIAYLRKDIDAEGVRARISKWERLPIEGKASKFPQIDEFLALCDILDVDADYLLGVQDAPRKTIADAALTTGLLYDAIKKIKEETDYLNKDILSAIILSPDFVKLLCAIQDAIDIDKIKSFPLESPFDRRTASRVLINEATIVLHGIIEKCPTSKVFNPTLWEHLKAKKDMLTWAHMLKEALLESPEKSKEIRAEAARLQLEQYGLSFDEIVNKQGGFE